MLSRIRTSVSSFCSKMDETLTLLCNDAEFATGVAIATGGGAGAGNTNGSTSG